MLNENKIVADQSQTCHIEYRSAESAWNAINHENGSRLFNMFDTPISVTPVGRLSKDLRPSDEQLSRAIKRSISVSNLPKNAIKEYLIERFSAYGEIVNKENIHVGSNFCNIVYRQVNPYEKVATLT